MVFEMWLFIERLVFLFYFKKDMYFGRWGMFYCILVILYKLLKFVLLLVGINYLFFVFVLFW